MTPAESLMLIRIVQAACPQMHLDEYTPDVWHRMMSDLEFRDCEVAVIEVGKRKPFMSPADIRAEVRRVRRDQIERNIDEVPDADPDDIGGYLRALREGRFRDAEPTRKRDVLGLIAAAARGKELPK